MQPIHLAIGLMEGIISLAVLSFIYESRPEMLWNIKDNKIEKENRFSYKKTIAILTYLFVIIGGGISLLASSNPDGLEWSIQKITGDTEIETEETKIYETSSKIQETTSFLPDYTFKDTQKSTIGTSVSGVVGSVITFSLLVIVGYIVKLKRKKGIGQS